MDINEVKWTQFKNVCFRIKINELHMISTAWKDFKKMRDGVVYLLGDPLNNKYWNCHLEYRFMSWTFADEILEELDIPMPEKLPEIDKEKLFKFWKDRMEDVKQKYLKEHDGAKWSEHHYYNHQIQRTFTKEEMKLIIKEN